MAIINSEIRQWPWAIVSGVLLGAAFPKINLDLLAWFALVPLIRSMRDTSAGSAFRIGFVAGIAQYVTLMYWLVDTMHTHGNLTFLVAVPLLFLLASYLAIYPAFWCMAVSRIRHPLLFVVVGPFLWVGLEYIRAVALTGFPWELLGNAAYRRLHIIQITDISGVYGVSFIIILCNIALGLLILYLQKADWQKRRISGKEANVVICIAAAAIVLTIGYGEFRLKQVEERMKKAETVHVGVVQGNILQAEKWKRANREPTIEKYLRLSAQASVDQGERAGLIVWPETAAPFYFRHRPALAHQITEAARKTNDYYLVGSPDAFRREDGGINHYNSAFLISPDGTVRDKYDKVHLVPFGEYVPMQRFLPFVREMVAEVGDFRTGKQGHTLEMASHRIGVQICYEGIFPELAAASVKNGAGLLANITNDAWYGFSSAPYQHYSMSILRASETKRAFIRSANTGVSALVAPTGRVLKKTRLYEDAAIARKLPVMTKITFYTRYGDWFAQVALAVLAIFAICNFIPGILRKTDAPDNGMLK